jgi:hypothetical protein
MKTAGSAMAALIFSGGLMLWASTRINDPTGFVTDVYRHFVEAQSTGRSYTPPEDIYTEALRKLFQHDKKQAKGEVGCLDFVFWVNAQDWTLNNLSVTAGAASQHRTTVIARFVNLGTPQEIQFDFRRIAGRWLLDDAHSAKDPRWTLSEILRCSP